MNDFSAGQPFSKWHLFADEFVSHLKKELYQEAMKEDQIAFVEKHLREIQQANDLSISYRSFLVKDISNRLSEEFLNDEITLKDVGWGLRCQCKRWGKSDVVWRCNITGAEPKYGVSVYISELSPSKLDEAEKAMGELRFPSSTHGAGEGGYDYWISPDEVMTRLESVRFLIKVAKEMDRILETP